jgi:hypothetical protein
LLPFIRNHEADRLGAITVFTIEHVMIVMVLLIKLFLDKDPAWVRLFKERQAYQRDQKTLKKQQ